MTSTARSRREVLAPPAAAQGAKGYEVTDPAGHRARAWWRNGIWHVAADDTSFGQRVRQALDTPLWIREDVVEADGFRSSTPVEIAAADRRYPVEVRWRWGQIGLDDVDVRVVQLDTTASQEDAAGGALRQPEADSPE